jgi:hypothetical protein
MYSEQYVFERTLPMTWNAFHTRGEILRTVVATADRDRDGVLPMHLPGVAENFASELDLLSALLLKWHARLSGNLERTLAQQPMDLELAVATAWRRTADEMPGVRAIVDRALSESEDPAIVAALRRATEREHVRLAVAAGLANDESEAAARVGARLEEQARTLYAAAPEVAADAALVEDRVSTEEVVTAADATPSFVDRIKAVLAA